MKSRAIGTRTPPLWRRGGPAAAAAVPQLSLLLPTQQPAPSFGQVPSSFSGQRAARRQSAAGQVRRICPERQDLITECPDVNAMP